MVAVSFRQNAHEEQMQPYIYPAAFSIRMFRNPSMRTAERFAARARPA
jgi:hypothetical protein